MDKPIPEAVSVTLHQDRAGCEWIIVTSKEHPDSESEVTPSDDPALFDLLKALTAAQHQEHEREHLRRVALDYAREIEDEDARAAQQQGQAVAWQRLEAWLGAFADSIPNVAYHELCAIQKLIEASPPSVPQGQAVAEPMTGDLLPCPFCGKSNQDRWPCEWLDGTGANVIRCAWCHGAAPAKTWNRRTAPPPSVPELPERYACNGPQGTFWTNDADLANKLIQGPFDRDDWTVTDTAAPSAKEARNVR